MKVYQEKNEQLFDDLKIEGFKIVTFYPLIDSDYYAASRLSQKRNFLLFFCVLMLTMSLSASMQAWDFPERVQQAIVSQFRFNCYIA